ncbi:hypothetical protein ACFLWC_01770 [Chloroflexota bacterium]
MTPKYEIGQKVVVMPVSNQHLSPRDADLEQYAGQSGQVTDYYWITKDRGAEVFHIYTVRIDSDRKEAVLHEDELKAYAV